MKNLLSFVALTATVFGAVSCGSSVERNDRTDAVEKEIFHGHPKTLRTITSRAYEEFGAWTADTSEDAKQTMIYTFDRSGNLLTETSSLGTGSIRYEYKPGSSQKTKGIYTTDDEYNNTQMSFRYDKHGRQIECRMEMPDGTVFREEYDRDKQGNCTETRSYQDDELFYREKNTYNEAGQLVKTEVEFYRTPKEVQRMTYTYSYQENGLKASQTDQSEAATIIEKESRIVYAYDYDAQGNWIRRVEHNETRGTASITEREIEYYD